jgi:hypothetical protein
MPKFDLYMRWVWRHQKTWLQMLITPKNAPFMEPTAHVLTTVWETIMTRARLIQVSRERRRLQFFPSSSYYCCFLWILHLVNDAISLNVQPILLMLPMGLHCFLTRAKVILGGVSGSCGSSGHKTTGRWDAFPCSQSQIIVFAT